MCLHYLHIFLMHVCSVKINHLLNLQVVCCVVSLVLVCSCLYTQVTKSFRYFLVHKLLICKSTKTFKSKHTNDSIH